MNQDIFLLKSVFRFSLLAVGLLLSPLHAKSADPVTASTPTQAPASVSAAASVSTAAEAPIHIPKSENREPIPWGQVTPDFITVFLNFETLGPEYAQKTYRFLKTECPTQNDPSPIRRKACRYIDLYDNYQRLDIKLKALTNSRTIAINADKSEFNLRAVNWDLDPFADTVEANSEFSDSPTAAIETIVEWLIARKRLAHAIEDISRYYSVIARSSAHNAQTVGLPLLKAHYSSPLLLGKIAAFTTQQRCLPRQTLCKRIKNDLFTWLNQQVEELGPHMQLARNFLMEKASLLPSQELEQLKALMRNDANFQADPDAYKKTYVDFLTQATLSIRSTHGPLADAKIGVIVLFELLTAFNGEIPQQSSSFIDLSNKNLASVEARIDEEITKPVLDLLHFIQDKESAFR